MREIKFRGQSKYSGIWVYGSNKFEYESGVAVSLSTFWHGVKDGDIDPETVGEYAGLKDKAGKEIYEGDIVTCEGLGRLHLDSKIKYDPVISFDWHGACIKHNDQHIRLDMLHNWGVIGNIYEHPELVKEG